MSDRRQHDQYECGHARCYPHGRVHPRNGSCPEERTGPADRRVKQIEGYSLAEGRGWIVDHPDVYQRPGVTEFGARKFVTDERK